MARYVLEHRLVSYCRTLHLLKNSFYAFRLLHNCTELNGEDIYDVDWERVLSDDRFFPSRESVPPGGLYDDTGNLVAVCGNGVVESNGAEVLEECDDGNDVPGDGCEPDCTITRCGNGELESGEECDDGNRAAGDGCNEWCEIEDGADMSLSPTTIPSSGPSAGPQKTIWTLTVAGKAEELYCMREPTLESGKLSLIVPVYPRHTKLENSSGVGALGGDVVADPRAIQKLRPS